MAVQLETLQMLEILDVGNLHHASKLTKMVPLFPRQLKHQVVLSSSLFSIWLQWNLCWVGTNKPNLVSNIISLEQNLISAPVL